MNVLELTLPPHQLGISVQFLSLDDTEGVEDVAGEEAREEEAGSERPDNEGAGTEADDMSKPALMILKQRMTKLQAGTRDVNKVTPRKCYLILLV